MPSTTIAKHEPVCLTIESSFAKRTIASFCKPPKVPVALPVGPPIQPPAWEGLQEPQTIDQLDEYTERWMKLAATEILACYHMDTTLADKWGGDLKTIRVPAHTKCSARPSTGYEGRLWRNLASRLRLILHLHGRGEYLDARRCAARLMKYKPNPREGACCA